MARKRQARTWIGALVFALIVIEIGIGLSNGQRMRNPFQVLSDMAALRDEIRLEDTSLNLQPRTEALTPGVTLPDGGLYNISLRWGDFRGVLFDWWFIAAVSVVIMVIGRPIGMAIKWLRVTVAAWKSTRRA